MGIDEDLEWRARQKVEKMMEIEQGNGSTLFGKGIKIRLGGNEIAVAIEAYLITQGIRVDGPRTIRVNGDLCKFGQVYVDPSGQVIMDGRAVVNAVRTGEDDEGD